ncbi:MAG: transposase [Deltaproteobacteria bacterium]|nr:transposase [Deltaproteobacteria bacterium]
MFPQARHIIAAWQHHYDAERPHGSLGRQTPEELRLIYPSPMLGNRDFSQRLDRNVLNRSGRNWGRRPLACRPRATCNMLRAFGRLQRKEGVVDHR